MKSLQSGAPRRPVKALFRRRYTTAAALLIGLVTMLWLVGAAFADAGNPVLGTITPTVHDNGNGTVTISVKGQWTWLSHKSDCNFDRAATGAGIIWSDPTESGYQVGSSGVYVGTASKNSSGAAWPGGPSFDPNPIDEMVHPVDRGMLAPPSGPLAGPAGQAFNDPSSNDPNDYLLWKGGCGRSPFVEPGSAINVTAASESPDGTGNLSLASPLSGVAVGDPTLQIAGMFNAGYNSPTGNFGLTVTAVDASKTQISYTLNANGAGTLPSCSTASTCKGKVNLEPWGSWGYENATSAGSGFNSNAFSHTYTKLMANGQSGLPSRVCVNFYDVHGGGNAGTSNFQKVGGASNITVDGNGDNSIQTNAFDVTQGANCINLTQPGLVTLASDATIGNSISDTATLSGLPAGGGGTLTFEAYGPRSLSSSTPNCSGTVKYTSNVAVTNNGNYVSSSGSGGAFTPALVGKYDWKVHYEPPAGSTILTTDSACGTPATGAQKEVSSVTPLSPTLTTNAHGPFTIGANGKVDLFDTATLSGGTSNATGTITFQLFSDASCTKQVGSDVTATVTNASGADYDSPKITVSAAGPSPYHWVANYKSGDVNNSDAATKCGDANENPVVNPLRPTLTTKAGGPYPLGPNGTVDLSDVAHLADGTSNATGTITFQLFKDDGAGGCGAQVGSDVTTTVTNASGVDYASPKITVSAAGPYHWVASYKSGDANNSDVATKCGDANENPVVNPLTPTVTTDAGPTVRLGAGGTDLIDSATLAGATSNATGKITFQLFSDATCTKQVGSDVTTTVAGNRVYVSPPVHVNAAGLYHWIANYGGDGNNSRTANGCNGANENVLVINPSIAITKKPDSQTIRNGGTATWTITVTNTGDSDLRNVVVTDTLAPGCAADKTTVPALALMASNAVVSYTCSLANVKASFTNTAVATGTPPVGPDVSAQDSADVIVLNPHITIVKSPKSQTIVSGQTASFTIQVINDGDSTLTNVVVSDALAPGCARTSADIPGLASMPAAPAAGSTITYGCTLANVTASFTNTAVATGTPPVGPNVSSEDTAAVTVLPVVTHPAISIVKDPKSQTVTKGGTASFTITVLNTGDVTLTNVVVSDPLSPNCDRTIGTLAPGASVSYKCTRPNVSASFTNVAVATGHAGGTTVSARDTAPVTAKAPFVPKVVPKVVSHKKPKATG